MQGSDFLHAFFMFVLLFLLYFPGMIEIPIVSDRLTYPADNTL